MINTIVTKQLLHRYGLNGLADELKQLQDYLDTQIILNNKDVSVKLHKLLSSGGKRLRPSLAYISAGIADELFGIETGAEVPDVEGPSAEMEANGEKILTLMIMLELMHTASLIHDDVIDGAPLRRGLPTLHMTNGEHTAVHCGDFILGKTMGLLDAFSDTPINRMLVNTSKEMCLGEICQMQSAFSFELQTEESYFQQIKRKTALLLADSCHTGAIVGGLPLELQDALRDFGYNVGMAFQLTDDILDFTGDKSFGKAIGQDMRLGIFTLPLLHAFGHHPEREKLIRIAEKRNKSESDMSFLLEGIEMTGGLAYTQEVADRFKQKAMDSLVSLPEGSSKRALLQIAEKTTDRRQ